jgi:hypothetical protein
MKPATAVCSGCVIALLAGGAGFQLGSRASVLEIPTSPAQTNAGDAAREASVKRPRHQDLKELERSLDAESDSLLRFSKALPHMETWVEADPEAALAWLLRQATTARRNEVIRLALGQWAEKAPRDAADWALHHWKGIDQKNILIQIAEQWAQSEPSSAARWFAGMENRALRTGPLEGLFFLWGAQDAASARAYLEGPELASEDRAIVTQAMLAGWAKSDPVGASHASLATSRRVGNPGLFANTLANWAAVDVAASAAWLDQHVRSGPERIAAIPELAGMFAHHDPTAGRAWIDRLPETERPVALNALATAWAQDDPGAAAMWLAQSGGHASRLDAQHLAEIIIGFHAADEPSFRQWLGALPDGPLKQQALELSRPADEP